VAGNDSNFKLQPELSELLDQLDKLQEQLEAHRARHRRTGLPIPETLLTRIRDLRASLALLGGEGENEDERELALALAQIGQVINSSLDLTTVLNIVIDTIIRLTGAERAFLMLKKPAGHMEIVVARNWEKESLRPHEFEISRTIIRQVIAEGRPVLTTNARRDPRYEQTDSIIEYSLRSVLCQPLILKGELKGVIYADNRIREGIFTERESRILETIANQAAVAIENAQLYQAVRQHAEELEARVAQRTEELARANEHLRRLSRLKDEFVSNVSHELRTPLSSFKLYTSLIEKRDEKFPIYIEALKRETDRLAHIIESLLRLSSMDQGHITIHKAPVDLNAIVSTLVSDRTPFAAQKQISLAFEPGPPARVEADRQLLIEAISVLLTNAINYSPPGSRVTVRALKGEGEQEGWFAIQVSDNGPGIPREEQAKLFQRFFRGKAGLESGISGTGLGLAIVKEIMDRHNGRVEVASSGIPGEGATFTLWLPA
jgi:signal transduction histidine kinase